MTGTATGAAVLPRATSAANTFLNLIKDPFASQLASDAFIASLVTSFGLTILIALVFCVLRPYNNVVYAPRAKHADSKHAPPPVSKGLFGWIPPLAKTKEQDFVDTVGLDAAVFMRFARMCRNMYSVLSVVGCGILIPVYLVENNGTSTTTSKRATSDDTETAFFNKLTPLYMYGSRAFWSLVVCAWAFDIIICFFLWSNYRAVFRLRRAYFDSSEYQRSLHARTLLLTDIPKTMRTDEGIVRITEEIKTSNPLPRAAIARNVKDLPDLVEEHEQTVRGLEGHLAKYLRNPDKLPAKRPTCKVSKNDQAYRKGQKVDAIEYLTSRIKELEIQIKEVRESIDKRNALSYGFASYESIPEAHTVAYDARKKGPQGTIVRLAPKPHDLVWKNLKLSKKERNWQNFINNLWVAVLTVLWVVPNILIAVFLSNLAHLGLVWPAFQTTLYAHPKLWAVVQGVLSPAITSLFYYYLPAIFRRLCINAGDVSKTSRERHVMHKLYSFFIINNLIIFSLFAAIWTFIAAVVSASKTNSDTWEVIVDNHLFDKIINALCTVSPYWISWLVQRNLGAAVDLSQVVNLAWGSFARRYLSPTPRQLIELSAPQAFDYAGYYNYFLFYATIAICFATIQPLVLPVAALYFWLDSWLKKYLLLYVFITKYESGGMFWRTLYNRFIFLALLGNVIVALVVAGQGDVAVNWDMLAAMAPLPFLLGGFKIYCLRAFDDPIHYYQTGKAKRDAELAGGEQKPHKGDRIGVRFGHPVLYKPLMTPMVSAKSHHLLKQIYSGRTSLDENRGATGGYSDVYLDAMDANQPGKGKSTAGGQPHAPFEIVSESQMDFEHYKNRPDFREEAGGDGELYGKASDLIRPGTPGSTMTGVTRTGTMQTYESRSRSESRHGRSESRGSDTNRAEGVEYPRGYHQTPAMREQSPAGSDYSLDLGSSRMRHEPSKQRLVSGAARMGRSPSPPTANVYAPTPGGFGPVHTPGSQQGDEETSYDYFRRGRGL